MFLSSRSAASQENRRLASQIDYIRELVAQTLPLGCPFVIGGGLVRDSILGGRPSDIDVWLPSNLRQASEVDFISHLTQEFGVTLFGETVIETIFRGPGHDGSPTSMTPEGQTSEYGDVNNHWVMELKVGSDMGWDSFPKVNFMRTMVQWENDAQAYFTGLMRIFDLDACMMFMGWMPGESILNSRTVIMPAHLHNIWSGRTGSRHDTRTLRMNTLHYNAARANVTSEARQLARVEKMRTKYTFVRASTLGEISIIPVESIVAVPVALSSLIQIVNRDQTLAPQVMNRTTQREQESFDAARALLPTQRQIPQWN